MYGSSRLGIVSGSTVAPVNVTMASGFGTGIINTFTRGEKVFELSNHLGNVLATVSDKKIQVAQASPNQNKVSYYTVDVVSASDYAPFGQALPGRTYNANFRYTFNGKELDRETGYQDYGMRMYGINGRFISVDPLTKEYPELSPYQFASNRPIDGVDLDGLEYSQSNKYGALESLSVKLYPMSPAVMQQTNAQIQQAQMQRQAAQALARQPKLNVAPKLTQEEKRIQQTKTVRQLDDVGYNADHSPKLLTSWAENKTWNNFADNIVTPMMALDGAYGLYKGGASLVLRNISKEGIAYRAINPMFAESTITDGFYRSGIAGRLGNDGIYANTTVEGAVKEFSFHNPGVIPTVFEVKYPISKSLTIDPPTGYFAQPLPFTEGANILEAPSLRAPGTNNLLIRQGAKVGTKIPIPKP